MPMVDHEHKILHLMSELCYLGHSHHHACHVFFFKDKGKMILHPLPLHADAHSQMYANYRQSYFMIEIYMCFSSYMVVTKLIQKVNS